MEGCCRLGAGVLPFSRAVLREGTRSRRSPGFPVSSQQSPNLAPVIEDKGRQRAHNSIAPLTPPALRSFAPLQGNAGQGGPDRRGVDDGNKRPPSVKASLSVAFGQRAPNRAGAREDRYASAISHTGAVGHWLLRLVPALGPMGVSRGGLGGGGVWQLAVGSAVAVRGS